jgi:hypothetical protein
MTWAGFFYKWPPPALRLSAAQSPPLNWRIRRRKDHLLKPQFFCNAAGRKPTRLHPIDSLPLELIRKIPALPLLHRTLLSWLESPQYLSY